MTRPTPINFRVLKEAIEETEKPMQCKDIPDQPIIDFITSKHPQWCNWFDGDELSVRQAFPPNTPGKLLLAKMESLIRRGKIDGCACGCRGDFSVKGTQS